jgi:predicted dehydrogenase
MALTVEDAKRMRTARTAAPKLTVQVGHQSCSWAMLRDAIEFTAPKQIGQITAIRARLDRNTPHGRPLWARPIYPDINPTTLDWLAFHGNNELDFNATRYVNWRYFWDYSQGQVSEGMSHQLAFWQRAMELGSTPLGIPPAVTMTGGLYRWNDGREVPDTMTVTMDFGRLLFTWDSGAGNGHYGSEEAVLGTDATVIKNQHIAWLPQKVTRPKDLPITRRLTNDPRAHTENFFAAIRDQAKPNCPFEIGFQTSVACRMAVQSLWSGRTVRWDAQSEQIV